VRSLLKGLRSQLFERLGIQVEIRPPRPAWADDQSRFGYQSRHARFDIGAGKRVLDVGNGGDPFPFATVLADRFLDMNVARRVPLVTGGKPFVLADVQQLPFRDSSFDFVCCSHVLQLVEDPLRACHELMRVAERGFIETPTACKDVLFAWAKGLQKWHVVTIGGTLCFFEYSERELEGIRSSTWRDLVFSRRHHPIQDVFYNNPEVFNVMFSWRGRFPVFVFRLDGSCQTLNATAVVTAAETSVPSSDPVLS
jgi:SAM-dependent methyltransferase